MDGWEATRRIKADPRTRDVLVLAISGHAFADSVKRAKDAGVEAFFIKPCLPATVLAKINEMLRLGQSFWCYRVRDEFTPWREVAALWGLLSVRDHLILGCGVNEIQEALSTPHTDRLELLGSVGAVQ
jgi:DNA-binding response OmpR family regulator